jgi:hypothetical protein
MTRITLFLILLAGVAHADAPAPSAPSGPHAVVVHVAPTTIPVGDPIELEAVIDAPYAETLTVRYRAIGEPTWHDANFERSSAGGWFATLPPAASPGVEYFIRGTDTTGAEVAHFASEQAPHMVFVDPSLVDRLEDADRKRLGGFSNEIALDVMTHDFGNRYDLPDRFTRGELVYTHRLLRVVHEIGFGFGSISGHTPLMSSETSNAVLKGTRYGFGQLRLRVHPSVFLDGRVGVGATQDGFSGNVRGQVSFGKPWRSAVQIGAEYFGDLGPSAWVRLQWDTAPPLLMGASVVRTDLPGAVLSRFGVYLAYDLAYRVSDRVSVKGQVSYGPRDGSAHFGGGLGTAVSF